MNEKDRQIIQEVKLKPACAKQRKSCEAFNHPHHEKGKEAGTLSVRYPCLRRRDFAANGVHQARADTFKTDL